jgi:hypothetical protein
VGTSTPGPVGVLLMVIGATMAGGVLWTSCGTSAPLGASLPMVLIGLSLIAFGSSMVSRERRARRARRR